MAISLQYHWATRFIKAGQCCSMPVQVGESVLAGCYSSTFKARAYVYDLIHGMHCSVPARVETYVDDM
eukprot:11312848-Alexandrium_andersonii.AAC.1